MFCLFLTASGWCCLLNGSPVVACELCTSTGEFWAGTEPSVLHCCPQEIGGGDSGKAFPAESPSKNIPGKALLNTWESPKKMSERQPADTLQEWYSPNVPASQSTQGLNQNPGFPIWLKPLPHPTCNWSAQALQFYYWDVIRISLNLSLTFHSRRTSSFARFCPASYLASCPQGSILRRTTPNTQSTPRKWM